MHKFTIKDRLWMWWHNICPIHLTEKINTRSTRICISCWNEGRTAKQQRQERLYKERQQYRKEVAATLESLKRKAKG